MTTYWTTLSVTLPVYALIALGVGLHRAKWVSAHTEQGLLQLLVNLFYPALILDSVVGSAALREPANVVWAPLVGFATTAGAMAASYYAGRLLGLTGGGGLRTFALAVGVCNYSFIPIPIMESMWDRNTVSVLIVHNVGVEIAIWTLGVMLIAGLSLRESWYKLFNPTLVALIVSMSLNFGGIEAYLPLFLRKAIAMLAVCAVPFGILLSGVTLGGCLGRPADMLHQRTVGGAVVLRLGLLAISFLLLAKYLPCSIELKRVIVVQSAMPSAMMSLWFANYYGGHALTATRVVVATTLMAFAMIPWWLGFGLRFVGV